jgi:hypothetical protein
MTDTDVVRIGVWSGPRNISTALMRSFENRADTAVVDEPLYAHYLATTGLDHPGRDEIVRQGETDWRRVVQTLLGPVPNDAAVFYQKHMAHHLLPIIERDWIAELTNVVLIRDPSEVVASYLKGRATVTATDIGLPQQVQLYDELTDAGRPPLVVDSADLLREPEGFLRALCDGLDVDFSDRMLHWPPGPRDSDGVWAPHWYAAVWRSTGFEPYRPREVDLDPTAQAVADECRPLYDYLHQSRLPVA